ncbi:hypothetical protein MMC08_006588 [Hypocenomyce scalaris]|nr:hypothetical protein [Hypocenomyce scalaris]
MPSIHSPIETFLKEYGRSYRHWEGLAERAKELCEKKLLDKGIQAISSHRTKSPDSLKRKLRMREGHNGGYKDQDHIREDIVDLAGVRIALFWPDQKSMVETAIKEIFRVQNTIEKARTDPGNNDRSEDGAQSTYGRRFAGYLATHYHVQLKEQDTNALEKDDIIEIQIVSVLQNAWAEVEHNIVYKAISGPASLDEHRILDSLNGLVSTGDLLLEQLHNLYVLRISSNNESFANEYELGSFLFKKLSQTTKAGKVRLDRIEVLRRLLKVLGKDTPGALESMLKTIDFAKNSPQFAKIAKDYAPFELGTSIYIMQCVLSTTRDDDAPLNTDKSERDPYLVKCEILVSAIIWVDDLFGPFTEWLEKLLSHEKTAARISSLDWILGSVESRRILLKEQKPSQENQKSLEILWNWFEGHPEIIVHFVFRIAKLGILRDFAKGFDDLTKINGVVHPLLEDLWIQS